MPWSDLTPKQQAFLSNYLVSSKMNLFKKKRNSKKNKAITADFEGLETVMAEAKQLLHRFPSDFDEYIQFGMRIGELEQHRNKGTFADGVTAGKALIAQMKQAAEAAEQWVKDLRAKVAAPAKVGNVAPEDAKVLEDSRQRILTAVGTGPHLPSKAEMKSAQAEESTFTWLYDTLTNAVGDMKKAGDDFQKAWAAARPKLEEIIALDLVPLAAAPSHGAAVALQVEAKALLQQGTDAAGVLGILDRPAATLALNAFMAKVVTTDALIAKLKSEIKAVLVAEHGKIAVWHDGLTKINTAGYLPADKTIVDALLATVKTDGVTMTAALASTDPMVQMSVLSQLADIIKRAETLDKARETAERNAIDQDLQSKCVGDAHRKGLADLSQADKASFDLVNGVLTDTNKVLGNVEVDRAFLDAKKTEMEAAAAAMEAAKKLYEPLKAEYDTEKKELEALEAEKLKIDGQIAAAGKKVPPGLNDQLRDINQKIGLKKTVMTPLEGPLRAAKTAFDSATQTADAAAKTFDAATKQKMVMDAVTHGPLSPDYGRPVDDDVRASLLKVIEKNNALGQKALDLVGTAKHPKSLAKSAEIVTARLDTGFSGGGYHYDDAEFAEKYAGNLMNMSASLPPDQIDKLGAYLDAGKQFASKPELHAGTFVELTKKRSAAVADATMDGGKVDIAKGRAVLDDVMFHPTSVGNATPELANHMLGTMDYLEANPAAREKIEKTKKPTTAGGQALVKASTGKSAGAQGDDDAGQAVMSAMLTPVYQGKVGSCFATSSIVRMREENPDMALDTFINMVKTGKYKPVSGVEVPVIQNVPADEDPLVRSLEYSAATATARAVNSTERTELEGYTGKGVDTLASNFKGPNWVTLKLKIESAISTAFTFVYDPEEKVSLSNDGSSDKGRYVLTRVDNGGKVNDKAAFTAAIVDKVMAQISDADLKAGVTKDQVRAMIQADAFTNAMKHTEEDDDGNDVEKLPWELDSGGHTAAAAKTIMGATGVTNPFTTAVASGANLDEAARTKLVLEGFMNNIATLPGDMATMRTVGQHGFNGLPNHPSLDKLKEGGQAKFAENMQREVYDKGAELKDTVLPKDRAAYMFDEEMDSLMSNAKGAAKTALEAGITAHRPSADMKPADFEKAVKDATKDYREAKAQEALTKHKKTFTDAGKPLPDQAALDKKLEAYRKAYAKSVDNATTNRLMKDMGAPEFVIADTNWGAPGRGGGVGHVFFVIVPDPTTGEPKVMQRTDPPGTLTYVGDDWLRKKWARVE